MGLGDEIMALGQARLVYKHTGKQAVFVDRNGRRYWHDVFSGCPYLPDLGARETNWVPALNAPGSRPYILGCDGKRFYFNDKHRAVKGELWFSAAELDEADRLCNKLPENFWVVEPNVKGTVSGRNKDWGWEKWQAVADALDYPLIQFTRPVLWGVKHIETNFRVACAALRRARGFLGTDGALHHAAAALEIPAVVVWGGYSSPKHLGYEGHINLHDGDEPCGSLEPCDHCREKMDAITVDMVIDAARRADSA